MCVSSRVAAGPSLTSARFVWLVVLWHCSGSAAKWAMEQGGAGCHNGDLLAKRPWNKRALLSINNVTLCIASGETIGAGDQWESWGRRMGSRTPSSHRCLRGTQGSNDKYADGSFSSLGVVQRETEASGVSYGKSWTHSDKRWVTIFDFW